MNSMRSATLFFILLLTGCEPIQPSVPPKFRIGEVVYHASNPKFKMVIRDREDGKYYCTWITETGESTWNAYREYELRSLEKVEK